MELLGKVALVTGAGSGIGKAAALLLARQGASVGVLSRTAEEIRQTATEIEAFGGRTLPLVADIADADQIAAAVGELARKFGGIDMVFANAGINGVWAPIDEIAPEEWDRTININLRGTYLTLHYTVPYLKSAGGGSIVITSSINGTRTFTTAGATAYACTKAAQVAMAQMLALELAKHRIRVNVICPGNIATKIEHSTEQRRTEEAEEPAEYPDGDIPLTDGKPGSAEDVAELVLFLVSERSRHISGTPIWIDGGQSLLV
jgi:NAD(P)-dependent dehydrogenase (short-subunit alcohol dehydrogenase family)